MFQPPATTRFDLNFSIFGFSVRVHPFFWVMGILFGASLGSFERVAIWVAVLFVSILIHELGHSFMMRKYEINSFVILYHMGGLAVPTSSRRSNLGWLQQIAISLAGPFAGFLFAGIAVATVKLLGGFVSINWLFSFIPIPSVFLFNAPDLVNEALRQILWINTFWGLINLLPVFPLDGGRVAQQIFMRVDPWNGFRNALWLSVVTGVALAVAGFAVLNSTYMAFLFGILALQSYQMIQGGVGPRF